MDPDYAHENIRQLIFLTQSLVDLRKTYKKHHLSLSIIGGKTESVLQKICKEQTIGVIVASASYVRYFHTILIKLAQSLEIPVILVDDASLLPPWIASDHAEYGAYTLRKKYWKKVENLPLEIPEVHHVTCTFAGDDLDKILRSQWYKNYLKNTPNTDSYPGGESAAQSRWETFQSEMSRYNTERNDPNADATSHLSPALHFGCISPLQIFHDLRDKPSTISAGFLEECFVRRELAINMCHYDRHPDSWKCLPDWVIKTLDHESGRTQASLLNESYNIEELIACDTDDHLWNAAQRELMMTGKIH